MDGHSSACVTSAAHQPSRARKACQIPTITDSAAKTKVPKLAQSLQPTFSRYWFPRSARVCTASESMAPEPDTKNAPALAYNHRTQPVSIEKPRRLQPPPRTPTYHKHDPIPPQRCVHNMIARLRSYFSRAASSCQTFFALILQSAQVLGELQVQH